MRDGIKKQHIPRKIPCAKTKKTPHAKPFSTTGSIWWVPDTIRADATNAENSALHLFIN